MLSLRTVLAALAALALVIWALLAGTSAARAGGGAANGCGRPAHWPGPAVKRDIAAAQKVYRDYTVERAVLPARLHWRKPVVSSRHRIPHRTDPHNEFIVTYHK